jgi:hypothetical protein
MATITAHGALKINQYVGMAFSTGMCFFPVKMMEGYKADTFTSSAAVAFQFFLGIMGTQIMLVSFLAASAARDQVPEAVKSVACLCFALYWAFFAIDDGTLHVRGLLPDAFPPEGIYANAALFAILSAVSFAGWAQAGCYLPNVNNMMPKGRPAPALLAGMANLAFFAIGCAFFAEPFVEMFLPNVLGTLPGAISTKRHPVGPLEGPVPPIMLIVDRAGKTMLFAILAGLAQATVGTEDTTYRLLRAWVMQGLFYMGTFARDGVLTTATGWPSPMRVASFVQVYAVLFYMTNTMMGMPYQLEKEPKKAK